MSHILHRDAPGVDFQIRGDGRTVYGLCVPYDTPTPIAERGATYDEVFRMGAFSDVVQAGKSVPFLLNHDRSKNPLGRSTLLKEDAAGLVGEFRVSKTIAGDEALELIRDGAIPSFSIGFIPRTNRGSIDAGLVERLRAKLMEVSAVTFPAYELATIGGLRNVDRDQDDEIARDQSEVRDQDQGHEPPPLFNRARALALLDLDLRSIFDESHRIARR